ncbi:hypothetical protein SDC9_169123 [bioreactor metagenome]|uniref:Uncharacterized protein n=1 Tax=bioreactor metagenome TaxID=1076179 RepID=A0A645GD29_9ZZZZ
MLFLTLRYPNFDLAPGILPVQRKGDNSVAFTIHATIQGIKFTLIQQQFTGASGIAHHVRGGHRHRRKVSAEQVRFAVFQDHIAVADVGFTGAQGFHFPPLQSESRFELFFDKVFVSRALVERDGG